MKKIIYRNWIPLLTFFCLAGTMQGCVPASETGTAVQTVTETQTEIDVTQTGVTQSETAQHPQMTPESRPAAEEVRMTEIRLTDDETKKLGILLSALCNTRGGSIDSYLTDDPVFRKETAMDSWESQVIFLHALNNNLYTEDAMDVLAPAVESMDEETISVTADQAEALIRMAGAETGPELKEYLNRRYHDNFEVSSQDGIYTIGSLLGIGEMTWKHEIKEAFLFDDGRLKITGSSQLQPNYGVMFEFEAEMIPDADSIFAGYRVEQFWITVPGFGERKECMSDNSDSYVRPERMSECFSDYIFGLDGALYQMPFPARELLDRGWEFEVNSGSLEAGGRKPLTVFKNGAPLSVILWNDSDTEKPYEECPVVWLKTGAGGNWTDVEFQLPNGVESGGYEAELPGDGLWGQMYQWRDPLYNRSYGVDVYLVHDGMAGYGSNGRIAGFEMGYAPVVSDRMERTVQMVGDWTEDPCLPAPQELGAKLELDHIYEIDIDGDRKPERVDIKYFSKEGWGEDALFVLIDGEVTASVYGEVDVLVGPSAALSRRGDSYILSVDGADAGPGNEIYREFLLKKRYSPDIGLEPKDVRAQYLELNRDYRLAVRSEEARDILRISPISGIFFNGSPTETEDYREIPYKTRCILIHSENGAYRLLLSNKESNDYFCIYLFDLDEKGVYPSGVMGGTAMQIDEENGLIEIIDRVFLIAFQEISTEYLVGENGELMQNGNHQILYPRISGRFTLAREMDVYLFNKEENEYRNAVLMPGEEILSKEYETGIESRFYFTTVDGTEGYIVIAPDAERQYGYLVDGVALEQYFEPDKLNWAG